MDDDEPRRMTAEEIALMRQLIAWRKANDIGFYLHRRGVGFAGMGYAEWYRKDSRYENFAVHERDDFVRFRISSETRGALVDSLGQAVDVLVVFGMVPARFSSAYRAGWDARNFCTDPDGVLDQDSWSEKLPAAEPTW